LKMRCTTKEGSSLPEYARIRVNVKLNTVIHGNHRRLLLYW
jgi:hypothetical protein